MTNQDIFQCSFLETSIYTFQKEIIFWSPNFSMTFPGKDKKITDINGGFTEVWLSSQVWLVTSSPSYMRYGIYIYKYTHTHTYAYIYMEFSNNGYAHSNLATHIQGGCENEAPYNSRPFDKDCQWDNHGILMDIVYLQLTIYSWFTFQNGVLFKWQC
jgi:hypothetical protein